MEFSYIRNKIRCYKKDLLLKVLYEQLRYAQLNKTLTFPVWEVLTLVKWTYLYAEEKYPYKTPNKEDFVILMDYMKEFSGTLYVRYLKGLPMRDSLFVIGYQQFYLQKYVHNDTFHRQLALYTTITIKHNTSDKFKQLTGLTIEDFILFNLIMWLYINSSKIDPKNSFFDGFIWEDMIDILCQISSEEKVFSYINLLTLNPSGYADHIKNYKKGIKDNDLQYYEMSFFTMYPFQLLDNKLQVIHRNVFDYVCNYYIYDFLKANDPSFTEHFGRRMEKYVELGLTEAKCRYLSENDLRKIISKESKVVDFVVDNCILIECKAIELPNRPSILPNSLLFYNALKDSIVKAYAKQMLTVANNLQKVQQEFFGIIITYKEFNLCNGLDIWDNLLKKTTFDYAMENNLRVDILPPQNLYIMDIATWDKVIQVMKTTKISLLQILIKAKEDDSISQSKKGIFQFHLDQYNVNKFDLTYLENESERLELE